MSDPVMPADPSAGSVRFGVVTCGKRGPGPYAEKFGPCVLEPGHPDDVPCRLKLLNGPGSVSVREMPVPDEIADAVADLSKVINNLQRTRRNLRRAMLFSLGALVLNLGATVWTFSRIFGWLP